MTTMSSAARMPLESSTPEYASVPVRSIVCTGLIRPIAGYLLFAPWGPLLSKLSAREITFPFLTSRAAATMSSGRVWFSVPISSLGPHLPQFLYFSAASRRSCLLSLRAGMEIPFSNREEKTRAATLSQPESRRMGGDKMAQQQKEEFHEAKTLRRARRVGARRHLRRAGLAEQAGAHHRPLRAGGPGRHHREDCGRQAQREPGPAVRGREPRRSGRKHRRRRGREIRARRLHRAHDLVRDRREREPVSRSGVRRRARFHRRGDSRVAAEYDLCELERAGANAARAHQPVEGQKDRVRFPR